jgi:hypothetical protein
MRAGTLSCQWSDGNTVHPTHKVLPFLGIIKQGAIHKKIVCVLVKRLFTEVGKIRACV